MNRKREHTIFRSNFPSEVEKEFVCVSVISIPTTGITATTTTTPWGV